MLIRSKPASRTTALSTGQRRLMTRRQMLIAGAVSALPGLAAAGPTRPLPGTNSAGQLEAWSKGTQVLVVMFSRPACAFCEALRREHLWPLHAHLANEKNLAGVRLIELDLSVKAPFAGASGRFSSSPAQLAASLGIRLAPTLAFFGANGELAERLVGYSSPDFYGAYLEQRLEQALATAKRTG
jgi:thiol-disulfide isomerase/thioredoxin